jgi:hypothetical protein
MPVFNGFRGMTALRIHPEPRIDACFDGVARRTAAFCWLHLDPMPPVARYGLHGLAATDPGFSAVLSKGRPRAGLDVAIARVSNPRS